MPQQPQQPQQAQIIQPNFAEVQKFFNSIDKDHSGFIDNQNEMQELIKMAGADPSKANSFLQACSSFVLF